MVKEVLSNNNLTNTDDWKKLKKEQLDLAYKLSEETCKQLSQSETLMNYFNVQSNFDKLSVNNAILITNQLPTARRLKDYKSWKEENATFLNKYPNKIIILEPGDAYINKNGKKVVPFNPKEVIDISETNLKPRVKNYDKKIILQALLTKDEKVLVKPIDSLDNNKLCEWKEKEKTIYIVKNNDFDSAINSLAKELAKMKYYVNNKVMSDNYAECIAYMICKKYGIEANISSIGEVAKSFDGKKPKEIKNELSSLKDVVDDMNNRIIKYLNDLLKNKDMEER